jgi:hypothetical protein
VAGRPDGEAHVDERVDGPWVFSSNAPRR